MSAAKAEPVQVAVPPPVGRDRMLAVWIAATTVSWFGDALWTVALAVTAVQNLSPSLAGVVLGLETLPQAVMVLLGGVIAAGAIAGRLLAIRHPPSRPARSALFVLVVEGAAVAVVAVDARPVLVPAMAVIGLAAGLASVWLGGVFPRTVAASHLGRVSSILVLGDRTMVPLALAAFGALAAGASLFVATSVFGLATGLLCLALATRPAIAKLT